MNTTNNAGAGKNLLWPGATPLWARVSRQNPFGLRGSLPAAVCPPCRRTSQLSRDRNAEGSCPSRSAAPTCTTLSPTEENGPMPLPKPPEPVIAQRRYYVRIEEPLALTMERSAEFLGTNNLDQVGSQDPQFIFIRDSQIKSWLERHPEPTPKPTRSKASSKGFNSFFSPSVQFQTERAHRIIADGPYRFVRHPGCLAVLISIPASALAIGYGLPFRLLLLWSFCGAFDSKTSSCRRSWLAAPIMHARVQA
jgi:Isoprenylcysteine carboxyl methyltransferase (ICMT) family